MLSRIEQRALEDDEELLRAQNPHATFNAWPDVSISALL